MGGLSIVFCMFTRRYPQKSPSFSHQQPWWPSWCPHSCSLATATGTGHNGSLDQGVPQVPLGKNGWLWLVYAWFMPFIVSFPITNGDFNHLAGWWCNFSILKNMSSSMGFGWHPIYEMENKSHVPNHQPMNTLGLQWNIVEPCVRGRDFTGAPHF